MTTHVRTGCSLSRANSSDLSSPVAWCKSKKHIEN